MSDPKPATTQDSHHNGTDDGIVRDGGADHSPVDNPANDGASIATTTDKRIRTKDKSSKKHDEGSSSGDGDDDDDEDSEIAAMKEDLIRYLPRGPPSKPAHGGVRIKR